jgi:hypothetical protein
MSARLPDDALLALEAEVQQAVKTDDRSKLKVLGYGEITMALRVDTDAGSFACKRMPSFPDRAAADGVATVIRGYIDALQEHGVDVIDTDIRILEGEPVRMYLVQPCAEANQIGPEHFRALDPEGVKQAFDEICTRLEKSITPELGPDGQLANWAFVGDRILYHDVSTPFHRHEDGSERLDWKHFLAFYPAPLRRIIHKRVLPKIMDNYHDLRTQCVDFLANLQKEKLTELIEPLTAHANARFEFDEPISVDEVKKYYADDAKTYAAMQLFRKIDHWFTTKLMGREATSLLAPPVDRNI